MGWVDVDGQMIDPIHLLPGREVETGPGVGAHPR
jgi:hypothetical protein